MKNLDGQTPGPYRIIERIALGGMAAVYLARQPSTEREVAVKVLSFNLSLDPSLIARFEREAELLAGLQHAHILPVFDFGREDDDIWFVTPLIRHGRPARSRWGPDRHLAATRAGQLPAPALVRFPDRLVERRHAGARRDR